MFFVLKMKLMTVNEQLLLKISFSHIHWWDNQLKIDFFGGTLALRVGHIFMAPHDL